MKIRPLKEKEIGAAAEMVCANFSRKFGKICRREVAAMFHDFGEKPTYLVAEEKGKMLGFAGYSQSWADYSIYNVFWVNVDPAFQRKGVGTALLKKIIREIKGIKGLNKASIILLSTTSPAFYKRLGFKTLSPLTSKLGKRACLMGLSV